MHLYPPIPGKSSGKRGRPSKEEMEARRVYWAAKGHNPNTAKTIVEKTADKPKRGRKPKAVEKSTIDEYDNEIEQESLAQEDDEPVKTIKYPHPDFIRFSPEIMSDVMVESLVWRDENGKPDSGRVIRRDLTSNFCYIQWPGNRASWHHVKTVEPAKPVPVKRIRKLAIG